MTRSGHFGSRHFNSSHFASYHFGALADVSTLPVYRGGIPVDDLYDEDEDILLLMTGLVMIL